MKVYIQIIDTITGIYQQGMIDEPVEKGLEIENALKHFGVPLGGCSTKIMSETDKYYTIFGEVDNSNKIFNATLLIS